MQKRLLAGFIGGLWLLGSTVAIWANFELSSLTETSTASQQASDEPRGSLARVLLEFADAETTDLRKISDDEADLKTGIASPSVP